VSPPVPLLPPTDRGVPLRWHLGLARGLTVLRKAPGAFSSELVELLQTFATQSALAFQNARRFREIDEKSRQLDIASKHKSQFLANMSRAVHTILAPCTVLPVAQRLETKFFRSRSLSYR